jgi:hypothetical protein
MLSLDHLKEEGLILIPLGEVSMHILAFSFRLITSLIDIITNNTDLLDDPNTVLRVPSWGFSTTSNLSYAFFFPLLTYFGHSPGGETHPRWQVRRTKFRKGQGESIGR